MCGVSVGLLFALLTRLVDRNGEPIPENKGLDGPSLVPTESQYSVDGVRGQIMPSSNVSAHIFVGFVGSEPRLGGHWLRRDLWHPHYLSIRCKRSGHVHIVRKTWRRGAKGEK